MANDVLSLQVLGKLCGQPVENVLHFEADVANSPTPANLAKNLADAFQATVQATWLAALPQNYVLGGYKAKRINNTGGPTHLVTTGGLGGGTPIDADTSVLAPVGLAAYFDAAALPAPVGHWRTGRVFFPGISADNINNNVIDPAVAALFTTLFGILITPIASGGNIFTFGIWSPTRDVFHPVNSLSLSLKIGVQRRRLVPM